MRPQETAYIIERLAVRFMAMVADHERQLAEHRASFGARTEADAKVIAGLREELDRVRNSLGIQAAKEANKVLGMVEGEGLRGAAERVVKERDGLLTQVQDMRVALAKEQELHAKTALRLSTEAAKLAQSKNGAWVKTTDGRVLSVRGYLVRRSPDREEFYDGSTCTPCDPPEASHDTPAGKEAAHAAAEPKPGDVVRLVRVPTAEEYPHDTGRWEPNWGGIGDYMRVHHVGNNVDGTRIVRAAFGLEWPISCIEIVEDAK